MSSNTENTMDMNISTHMAAFIETHGGLDLGEFYKWFKGGSPEEIIHTYNSMLLAKYNKEMRGKLEKFDVEKNVSSIKEQLDSLPSGESLHETIGGLSQVEKDVSSIKEQLKSLPSLPNLQTVVGGLSLVEESYTELVGGLSRVDDDVSSIKGQLKSLPSVETLQSTVMECISLKDTVECMCKTIDVLMNENRRISSLIDKPSTVSDHQREWAALTVCYNDLVDFIKKEWAEKELKIGHINYDCYFHTELYIDMRTDDHARGNSLPELSMDEFLLSIERLFKINIPSIYDDVHLHLEIRDVSVTTGTQPLLEIPDQTVGAWLKEIREFPGKLRANPDSYFLIKRKEIIPPVIFEILKFMTEPVSANDFKKRCDRTRVPLLVEAEKRKLAWQRELVK